MQAATPVEDPLVIPHLVDIGDHKTLGLQPGSYDPDVHLMRNNADLPQVWLLAIISAQPGDLKYHEYDNIYVCMYLCTYVRMYVQNCFADHFMFC